MIKNKRWYILTFFVYFDSKMKADNKQTTNLVGKKSEFSDSGLGVWSDEQVGIQEFEFDLLLFVNSYI